MSLYLQAGRTARIILVMAGTPEGIRKANEAKARKRAAREAAAAAAELLGVSPVVYEVNQGNQLNQVSTMVDGIPVAMSDGMVPPDESRSPAVALARQTVASMAPEAAAVLGKMVRGQIKVQGHVRAQVAIRLLEMAGVPLDTKAPAGGELGAGMVRLFDAFSKIAKLRERAAGAETVAPLDQVPAVPSQ